MTSISKKPSRPSTLELREKLKKVNTLVQEQFKKCSALNSLLTTTQINNAINALKLQITIAKENFSSIKIENRFKENQLQQYMTEIREEFSTFLRRSPTLHNNFVKKLAQDYDRILNEEEVPKHRLKTNKSPDPLAVPLPEKENERIFGKVLTNVHQELDLKKQKMFNYSEKENMISREKSPNCFAKIQAEILKEKVQASLRESYQYLVNFENFCVENNPEFGGDVKIRTLNMELKKNEKSAELLMEEMINSLGRGELNENIRSKKLNSPQFKLHSPRFSEKQRFMAKNENSKPQIQKNDQTHFLNNKAYLIKKK